MERLESTVVRLDHLRTLTDDTGVLQHARGCIPDRSHGYCTDDNARAVIAALLVPEVQPKERSWCEQMLGRYMSFLDHAFNREIGRFRNFLSYDRQWREEVGSEDSQGRAHWALGVVIRRSERWRSWALDLLRRALPAMETTVYARSMAFVLLGLHDCLASNHGDGAIAHSQRRLAHRLYDLFASNAETEWPWPEDRLTYANARIPHALLLAGRDLGDEAMLTMGLDALSWLLRIQRNSAGRFSPIGNEGWYVKGASCPRYGQQPIEAAAAVDACLAAARVTRNRRWHDAAEVCAAWFLGDNDGRMPMIDPSTGGCYDGLYAEGVNPNQGAESLLVWLISACGLIEHRRRTAAEAIGADAMPVRDAVTTD